VPFCLAASAVLQGVVQGDNPSLRILRAPVDQFVVNVGRGVDIIGSEVLLLGLVILVNIGASGDEELYVEIYDNLGHAVDGGGD
jgi:hypothetical protein